MSRFDQLAGLTEVRRGYPSYKQPGVPRQDVDAWRKAFEGHNDKISEHLHQGIGALNSNLKDAKKAGDKNMIRGLTFTKKLLEDAAAELVKMRKTTAGMR